MSSNDSSVETTLSLSKQPPEIDVDTSVELTVNTNADTYTVELDNNNIQYEKKDNNVLKLTAVKVGLTAVKIKATANNGTEKNIIWYIKAVILPTTLEVTNNPSELNLGEKIELDITTNATSFTITSSNPDVIKVGSKPNEIIASSLGNTRVFLRATKHNAVEKVIEWDLAVKYVKPVTDKGTASTIKLCNTNTKRIVTLATTDNESIEDITVSLPRSSGTLITEESLHTTTRLIHRPYIIQPAAGTEFFTGKFIGSDFKTGTGYQAEHTKSVWQVARDSGFKNIVMEKEVIPETILELQEDAVFKIPTTKQKPLTETILDIIGTFYVRVKYIGGNFESDWSRGVYVNLGINALHGVNIPLKVYNHPESGSWTAPRGLAKLSSWYDGAYFGIVPHSNLVKDYDFRGTFNTIKNAYNPARYTDQNGSKVMIKMRKGYQVIHDKKLWYALVEMANQSKDTMIVPGTDGNKWKEDVRTALGSPSVVYDMIGIGHGLVDNNYNSMSNSGDSIGPLVNHEDGYIKYVYKGKLCYTTPKPTCNAIAWTDIAQRELAHQQKTIRLGKHLFKVRLFEEDEYIALMYRMMDGTYDTKTPDELELSKKVWIHDRQTGSVRKVVTYVASNGNIGVENLQVTTLDPKSRRGSYRYVLEYIPEECAPYNNINSCFGTNIPKASNEYFRYDPYTDVGFFGVVSSNDLIMLDTLANRVGFTSGSRQHPDAGFLKFYWHGMMIYIAKKPPIYNISWNIIKNHNCQYGWDMGNNDSKFLCINGVTYRCSNILAARSSPCDMSKMDFRLSNGVGNIAHTNVINENIKYSQWSECILRIGDCYGGYEEVDGVNYFHELDEIPGMQIGDHFQKMSSRDIVVKTDTDGNGAGSIGREIGTNYGIVIIGNRGFNNLYWNYGKEYTNGHASWRPVLMLDAKY